MQSSLDFTPSIRAAPLAPPLDPPKLARQRSNSAEVFQRDSPIGSSHLRAAVRAGVQQSLDTEDVLEQPALGRQRSNSLEAFKNNSAGLPRARTAGGGEITPRAARLETLEWEDGGGRTAGPERGENECIRVAARFRPLNELELKEGSPDLCVEFGEDGKTCTVAVDRLQEYSFYYDHMFQPGATQADVYQAAASPIVDGVINGFNGAILAYGQTGSGKTHTMLGPAGAEAFQSEAVPVDFDQLGIIPRALQSLLDYAAPTDGQVQLRASYVEIYNEHIIDLLSIVRGGSVTAQQEIPSATLRERAEDLYLPDVTETPVNSLSEAMEVMRVGNRNRHMAETSMNRHSSRSHAVFIVTVTNTIDKAKQKFAQLYLVDLAGSERLKKTNATGQRMEEAKQINKSLLALGQVIWALAHKQKHIPYRDSKLTQLLRNCLGGNARTVVMIAASPHPWNINESVSALRFGARASLVQNVARVNVAENPKELKRLLQRAREDLNELRSHCRKLQSEVAAFTAVESMPSFGIGGVEFNSSAVEVGPAQALSSKRLLVWGLLPSLICPLNGAIMREPVVAADGWTYERLAIEKHFARAGRSMPISPVSGQRMCSRHVVPSHTIKQLIRQHMPDLAPPEVRLPVIVLLPAWLVMDVLSYLDAKSLARSESAWTSFSAAIVASRAWSKALARDFSNRAPSLQRTSSTGSTDSGPSSRAIYSQIKTEERRSTRQEVSIAPASKGLKLVKPPTA